MTRLLVVDDERDIRHLYAAELEEDGYQVDTAGSGAEAAELPRKSGLRPDRPRHPDEGGERPAAAAENRPGEADLPVILCTAFSCYKDDFSSWLADAYVVKSSDLTELKEEVRRVLKRETE